MRSKSTWLALLACVACHSHSDSDSPAPVPVQPLVFDLGVAAVRVFGTGDRRLVAVSEEASGIDLDGDQDLADAVLHIFDLRNGGLSNTGLAFPFDTLLDQAPRDAGDVVPPARFACNGALGVFQISEAETGADLDLDGTLAVTSWVFNLHTGHLSQLPFVHSSVELGGDLAAFGDGDILRVFDARDGSLTTRAVAPATVLDARDGLVAFTLAEAGVTDWNADGDTSDFAVMQLYDANTRRIVNTTLESVTRASIADGFAGFNASEAQNGGLDLNGDGDADDLVFVAVEGATGLTRILPFGGAILDVQGSGPGFLLGVLEAGVDVNGDGDGLDRLTLFYDPRSQRILDTGLATTTERMERTGRWIGLSVPEAEQGADLDGDGKLESTVAHVFDTETGRSVNLGFYGFFLAALEHQLLGVHVVADGDVVLSEELFVWDARTGRTRQTGLEVSDVLSSAGDRALLVVGEHTHDLNGDGDLLDLVLGVYDGATGTVLNLGLATTHLDARLDPDGQTLVLVSEFAQGRDLDGDGDELDDVLFWIDLEPENQARVAGE